MENMLAIQELNREIVNGLPIDEHFASVGNQIIERIEGQLLAAQRSGEFPSVEIPLTHRFAPGIYLREVFMPAGSFVIGHEHVTEHFNVILQGDATVSINGVMQIISGPYTFVSKPGVRKILYIHKDMIWQTVHPNPENITDIKLLESLHVIPTQSYQLHLLELDRLKLLLHS